MISSLSAFFCSIIWDWGHLTAAKGNKETETCLDPLQIPRKPYNRSWSTVRPCINLTTNSTVWKYFEGAQTVVWLSPLLQPAQNQPEPHYLVCGSSCHHHSSSVLAHLFLKEAICTEGLPEQWECSPKLSCGRSGAEIHQAQAPLPRTTLQKQKPTLWTHE